MDLKKTFGVRVKELRNKKKMTQFELAEAIGIDEKHLSHIETGKSFPKAVLIEKLIKELEINYKTLFDFPEIINREKMINEINKIAKESSDKRLLNIYKVVIMISE